MKKITQLLTIVGSLALAGAVMAQDPTPAETEAPGKDKKQKREQPAATKPAEPKAPKSEAAAPKTETPAVKEQAPTTNQAPVTTTKPETPATTTKPDRKGPKTKKETPATAPSTSANPDLPNATTPSVPATTPDTTKKQTAKDKKKEKVDPTASAAPSLSPATASTPKAAATSTPATARTTASPAATTASSPAAATTTASTTPAATSTPAAATTTASTTPATATASTTPATGATTTPAAATTTASATAAASTTTTTGTTATTKKIEPAKVQQIRQQHTSFRAQARPQLVPPVTFSAGFRLPGVETWTGPQYEVYRTYRPERRDRGWYSSRYQRVELIAGGYYYFNNGYWYPAWGYDPANEYYAYDAPIYVGKRADPPDRVIADVQAALKEMGYYRGEVDGLIGPLTREALTGYQRDNGMTVTAVIDPPTLDSLGMSS